MATTVDHLLLITKCHTIKVTECSKLLQSVLPLSHSPQQAHNLLLQDRSMSLRFKQETLLDLVLTLLISQFKLRLSQLNLQMPHLLQLRQYQHSLSLGMHQQIKLLHSDQ